jgi:hypothetical protein
VFSTADVVLCSATHAAREKALSPGTWLLPAIALLSGLASLQVDPQKEPKKKWILMAMLVVSAVGTVWVTRHDDNVRAKEKTADEANITFLKNTVTSLSGQSQHISETTESVLHLLENAGVAQSTIRVVQQAQAADASRAAILEQTRAVNQHEKAVVWYYPKDVDGPKVRAALEQGGFIVTDKPGNPHNLAIPTNAIWVGDNITLEQAKFVALTLTRAGVQIKEVGRLQNGKGNRASVIEVGSAAKLQSAPPMSAEEISNLSELRSGYVEQGD